MILNKFIRDLNESFFYGANGSIGSKVVEGLLEKGHEVYAGSRHLEKGRKG